MRTSARILQFVLVKILDYASRICRVQIELEEVWHQSLHLVVHRLLSLIVSSRLGKAKPAADLADFADSICLHLVNLTHQ